VAAPFPPDDARLASLREALPAVAAGIHLDAATAGPLPAETAAAMAELAGWELRTGRSPVDVRLAALERLDEARAAVAAVLTADVDDVAIVGSAGQALAAAAWAVALRRGDGIVTTTAEHPDTLAPLVAIRDRIGARLEAVDPWRDGSDDAAVVAAVSAAIEPRTRLVVVSHVSHGIGAVLPVAAIAARAHAVGAVVVVDGSQAAGAIRTEAPALGVDAYAVPGHRWLLGPFGVAGLWIAPDAADRLRPAFPVGAGFEHLTAAEARPWPDARRFDATDLYRPAVLGLARSVGWWTMQVGLPWAVERAGSLAAALAGQLASLDGVTVLTPPAAPATIVTFRIRGWDAEAALRELGARAFVIARPLADLDAIRFAVGWWATAAELERAVAAVELLAAHGPETLPPRRRLEIVGGGA